MKEIIVGLKNWNVSRGRSTRREYWFLWLFITLFSFLFGFLVGFVSVLFELQISEESIVSFLNVYQLIAAIPLIFAGIRRMHDVGKSGWFLLVPFYNIYLLVQPSKVEENKYGPYPHPLID